MYIPAHFHEIDVQEIAAVLETAPLASIVAQTAEGLVANHLPLLVGPRGTLIGHVALANDMHRVIAKGQDVLAIFRGDDAYVTPNAYPSKALDHRVVPTWNYQVVHVYGAISFQHDRQTKHAAVGLLTRLHERRVNGEKAWKMADAPQDFLEEKLAAIVAFRIDIRQTLAKTKHSQNRPLADYDGVITSMRERGHVGMADTMQRRRPKED